MFKYLKKLSIMIAVASLIISGCQAPTQTKTTSTSIEISDLHGKVTVPVNPKKVVVLDSRSFQTLSDWNVKIVGAPKDVMDPNSAYVKDETIQNIGNHREPNLELLASLQPDLVIVGQRFAKHYDTIKKLLPNSSVIDLNFDVSEKAKSSGENLVNGLKNSTEILGKIFQKENESKQLIQKFDDSINAVKKAYKNEQSVMAVIVSGSKIGYAAPKSGRVFGPMFEIFNFKPALTTQTATSDHKGDEVSVEAIAQSNPHWLLVLDRDAATSSAKNSQPAKDVIENAPALKSLEAIQNKRVYYAPNNTYTNESIETITTIFEQLALLFSK